MNCRDAGRFVCCGFVYVIVCYGAANSQCFHAPLLSRVFSAYGAAHFVPVSFTCCHAPWGRARGKMVSSSLRGAAHSYVSAHPWCCVHACCRASVLPRICVAAHLCCRAFLYCRAPVLPRSCQCCRAFVLPRTHCAAHLYAAAHPWRRAFICIAAPHGATRGRTLHRRYVWLCCRALYMLPHSSMCCREPMVPRAAERYVVLVPRSILRAAALRSFVSAQLSLVAAHCRLWPRSVTCCRAPMVPRTAVRFIVYVWPRIYTGIRAVLRAAALHGAARGTTLRVFAFAAAQWSGLL